MDTTSTLSRSAGPAPAAPSSPPASPAPPRPSPRGAVAGRAGELGRLHRLRAGAEGRIDERDLQQDGRTRDLMFDVPSLIAHVTSVMTLLPGDVILTGTPEGVGPMLPGQEVTVTVEGIGSLTNVVASDRSGDGSDSDSDEEVDA